jgi:type IV secretion system protein TrbL
MVSMETPNDLMVAFSDTISGGFAALAGPVNGAFGLVIALVVALTGIQWALSANRELLAAGFGKVLLVGAFAWLINDWQTLTETVQAGFIELGLAAGGGGLSRADFLNPGAVLETGWSIVKALGEGASPAASPLDLAGQLTDAVVLGLAMIGVLLAFAILALQIIVTLLEFKIVTLGGLVLLPFGIWSKSAFLAERPLGYVVSSGLKVLALAIVISGARSVFDRLTPSASPDLYEALAILAAALLLAMLAIFIPNLASALVTGGPALGAGAALTGGLAVGGTAALAAAGAGAAIGLGGAASASAFRSAAGAASGRPPTPPRPPGSTTPGPGPTTPPRSSPTAPTARPAGPAQAPTAEPPSPEMARAEADFRRTLASVDPHTPKAAAARRRSAALQAFVLANAGRGLLPGHEGSGALTPDLKPEEP